MSALSIEPTYPTFTDSDGSPLDDGYVWIGAAGSGDPIGNPQTAYWDAALTQVVTQPVRTRGGYPLNAGAIGRLYVAGDYSILVRNRNGYDLYSAPNATERISSELVTFLQAGTGAVTRTAQSKMRDVVSVFDFMTAAQIADVQAGTALVDVTAEIQAAFNSLSNGSTLLFPRGTYKVSSTITVGGLKKNITIEGYGAALAFISTFVGDGLDLSSPTNQSDQRHVVKGLSIIGPDPVLPGVGYMYVSTGAGIKFENTYDTSLQGVYVQGFKYGLYSNNAINATVNEGSSFVANQYGLFLTGATNANTFIGCKIRLNRFAGIWFERNAVSGFTPVHNNFIGCLIESNIPYFGGYAPSPGDGSSGVGVRINRSYDHNFDDCYFENNEYSIWIENLASGHTFRGIRQDLGTDGRVDKIRFVGPGVNNNVFINAKRISNNTTTPHVESDNSAQNGNQFLNCVGYNFIAASILSRIDVSNNRLYIDLHGTPRGEMRHFYGGIVGLLGEGTTRGRIEGIGTATAKIHMNGIGEFFTSNALTADTTVDTFVGLTIGQLFTVSHANATYKLTIASSTDGLGSITLKNRLSAILQNIGDSITFYVNSQGRAMEVGRSIRAPRGIIAVTPGNINNGASYSVDVTVPGAALGNLIAASWNANLFGCTVSGSVISANTVKVVITNNTGGVVNLPLGSASAMVINA